MFKGFEDREEEEDSGQSPDPWNGLPIGPGRVVVASDWDLLRVRSGA